MKPFQQLAKIFIIIFNSIQLVGLFLKLFFFKNQTQSKCHTGKHALILTSDFLPAVNGGVYRPLSWLRHGKEYGWVTDLVTVKWAEHSNSSSSNHLMKLIPEETKIYRSNSDDYPVAYNLSNFLCQFGHHIYGMYKHCLSIYSTSKPTHIIATGPSFFTFIVAANLSMKFKVPLILDYRDEWNLNPFDFVNPGKFEKLFEKKALELATLVTFTTQSMQNYALKRFPVLKSSSTAIVHNGIEPTFPSKVTPINSPKIYISYLGFLGNHCSVEETLSMLSNILERNDELRQKLVIRLIGKKDPLVVSLVESFAFPENLSCLDQVPLDVAANYMNGSAANMLFLNKDFDRYIPGKLYDYLATLNPIICFSASCKSEVFNLLNEINYEAYFIKKDEHKALEDVLTNIVANHLNKKTSNKNVAKRLKSYSRKELAKKFFYLLDKL